jgi:hypothetical protein
MQAGARTCRRFLANYFSSSGEEFPGVESAAALRTCSAKSSSTMRPPRMTAIRVAIWATTGRLCEIKM